MALQISRSILPLGWRLRFGPYSLAVLTVLLGLLLRFLIDPWLGDQMPYITFLVSVAVTGLYAGVGPSLVSTVLGASLAYFCFVPPRYKWGFAGMSDAVGFLAYLAAALGIVFLTRARNKAHRQAEDRLHDRIAAERKLHDAQQILQQFLENRPGCAYLRNPAGQYVYYNNEARERLGISHANAESTSELRLMMENLDRQALAADDGSRQFIDRVKLGDEERYWLTTKFIFIDHAEQKLVGSLSLDITSQIRAEQLVMESEKLAAATQMVASVAHEINNPLAAVTSSVFLLGREPLSPTARQLVTIAQNELSRLTRITAVAIGFYKETEPPIALDPRDLVEDVVNRIKVQFPDGDSHIKREFSWKGTFVVPIQIRRALENVLVNSLEAGASRIWIRVALSRDWRGNARTGIRFSVLDDGCGMSPEQSTKAFDPFFSTKAEKGTGLGLWIAKSIALRNAGQISLRSSRRPQSHHTCVSMFFPDSAAAGPVSSFKPKQELARSEPGSR